MGIEARLEHQGIQMYRMVVFEIVLLIRFPRKQLELRE